MTCLAKSSMRAVMFMIFSWVLCSSAIVEGLAVMGNQIKLAENEVVGEGGGFRLLRSRLCSRVFGIEYAGSSKDWLNASPP